MLRVEITNIDGPYTGVFSTDDKMEAIQSALAALVKDHGFFKENTLHPCDAPEHLTPYFAKTCVGILLMPGQAENEEEIERERDGENTYWVFVDSVEDRGGIMFSPGGYPKAADDPSCSTE